MNLIEILQAFQVLCDLLADAIANRYYRQAQIFSTNALLFQHAFDTGRVAFCKQQVNTMQQFIMQFTGLVEFAFQRTVHHNCEVFGKAVGRNRYNTLHAYRYLRQHQVVIA